MLQAGVNTFPTPGYTETLPMALKITDSLTTLKPEINTQHSSTLHVSSCTFI